LKKVIISILIGLLVIGAVVAVVIAVNRNREQEDMGLTTIQLNEVTRSVFYAPQYVAIANGYFEQVRVIRPFINIDLRGSQYNLIYSVPGTSVSQNVDM